MYTTYIHISSDGSPASAYAVLHPSLTTQQQQRLSAYLRPIIVSVSARVASLLRRFCIGRPLALILLLFVQFYVYHFLLSSFCRYRSIVIILPSVVHCPSRAGITDRRRRSCGDRRGPRPRAVSGDCPRPRQGSCRLQLTDAATCVPALSRRG